MELSKESNQSKRKVAIYIRVSTAEQKIDGYSLEAQEKRLLEYADKGDLEVKKSWIYKDVHTGSDLSRKNLDALRKDVAAGKFDAVLVWKIDRLSRNLKHLLTVFDDMQKHDTSFISVQENIDFKGPFGNLIFQIFGAIAEFERELIKGRTQMGKIASAEMGNYTGTSIPYGYKEVRNKSGRGRKIDRKPEEVKWVKQIFDWYIYEGLGYGQVANRLNELGVPKTNHLRTKRASIKWTSDMIRNMIKNPVYRGIFVANTKDEAGNVLPDEKWTIVDVPSCVSTFTFLQAQECTKNRNPGGTGGTSKYLLTGKLIDITLDEPRKFVGAPRYKGGFSYRRKQFYIDEERIPVFEVPGQPIEDYVWSKVLEALKEPEVFIEHYLSKKYADPTRIERLEDELATLRKAEAEANLSLERIEEAYERGAYSEDKLHKKTSLKHEEIAKLEDKIQEVEDQLTLMSSVDVEVQKLKDAAQQVRYRLDDLDNKQKKILCYLFVDRIEMSRTRKPNNKGWKVEADIYFKFNPKKFSEKIEEGRTSKTLGSAKRGDLRDKKPNYGGRRKT